MADESELRISGDEFPPTSIRGATETLQPVDNAQFDKYRWSVSCSDKNAPSIDAIRVGSWRRTVNGGFTDLSGNGSVLTVDCISELAYRTLGGSPAPGPQRSVVSGSSRTADGFTFYRPQLTIGVTGKTQETDEYGAVVQWQLEGEEL